jgi:hypothetical protein
MSIGGVGMLFIFVGLGVLLMAGITAVTNAIPPRSTRLEIIRQKMDAGEPLTSDEQLEERQTNFERKMPVFGLACLLIGVIAIAI